MGKGEWGRWYVYAVTCCHTSGINMLILLFFFSIVLNRHYGKRSWILYIPRVDTVKTFEKCYQPDCCQSTVFSFQF